MKDYTLSEVASVCISKQTLYNGTVLYDCKNCELEQICSPAKWGSKVGEIVEPRDMIELPYKQLFDFDDDGKLVQVVYRGRFTGLIHLLNAGSESEADTFLAKLKEDKQ